MSKKSGWSDWSPEDLLDLSDECSRIYDYHGDASDELKPLLVQFRILGNELLSLSTVMRRSGHFRQSHYDPNLRDHIIDAKQDLEAHFLPNRSQRRKLKQDRINKLYQYASDHHTRAKNEKSELLLLTAVEKLESLKHRQENISSNREDVTQSQVAVDVQTGEDHGSKEVHVPPDESTPSKDDPSGLEDVTTAFHLARIVFRNRAEQSGKRPTPSPNIKPQSTVPNFNTAREKFVNDVLEIIKETRLYAQNTVPQSVLEKLTRVVSEADRLKSTLTSPKVSPQTPASSYAASSYSSGPGARSSMTQTSPEKALGPAGMLRMRLPSIQRDPGSLQDSIEISLTDRTKIPFGSEMTPQQLPAPASRNLEPLSIGLPAVPISNSVSTGSPRSDARQEETVDVQHGQLIGDKGWIRVSSRHIGLEPTLCSLRITESGGSICVDAMIRSERASAGSVEGPGRNEKMSPLDETSSPGRTRIFKHLFTPERRPIPSVWYPDYEGPSVKEPYTIAFTEKQFFHEDGTTHPLQQVPDLIYSFEGKDHRDQFRSLIFGKDLLVSAGVLKVTFNHRACGRQAISLWYDRSAKTKSITFPREDRTGHPQGEKEYTVFGIEEYSNIEDKEEPLVLFVRPAPESDQMEPARRRSSTRSSIFSSGRMGSSKVSAVVGNSERCSLFFADLNGKKKFLEGLQGAQ